jgi:hypothetical protein
MHSRPITNMLNTVKRCSRSPSKKDEIIVKGEIPPPQEDHRKRRRVMFDDRVHVFEVPTSTKYTNDEVMACWYTASELQLFRSQRAFLKNTAGEDYCERGPEHLTMLRTKVNARLKGLSDEAEEASHHGKDVIYSRIVRSLWKGLLFQQQKGPEMYKNS